MPVFLGKETKMVRGMHKSRTLRRVHVKTPGGNNKTHYKKGKPGKAHCSSCGALLKGVPRERPYKMQGMAKTEKRPQRPFGGVLCTKCMRELMKKRLPWRAIEPARWTCGPCWGSVSHPMKQTPEPTEPDARAAGATASAAAPARKCRLVAE